MATGLDDDVLRLIFEDFTHEQLWKWPDAAYDQEEAQRPFLLAAVSRRWRSLALDTANIWTYFGFPGDAELYPKHMERLRVLLVASKNASVDIILALGNAHDFNSPEISDTAPDAFEVLEALGALGPRWRNVCFRLPSNAITHLRVALESPLPNLVSLSAVTGVDWNILPPAPRLKQLYIELEWSQLATSNGSTPMWHYPFLSSFTVMGEPFAVAFCAQNFATLTEVCFNHDTYDQPDEPLQLPQVVSLTFDDARYLTHIHAPRLSRLCVGGNSTFELDRPLSGYATVKSLVLYGEIGVDLSTALRPLSGIQVLEFHAPKAVRTCFIRPIEWSTSASFFCSLNEDARGLTWPLLERIRFRRSHDNQRTHCYNSDLFDFVEKRNTDLALSQRTARIAEIIIEQPGVIISGTVKMLADLTTVSDIT